MKMDKVASSQNDEFYTPEYAIKPILKFCLSGIRCPPPPAFRAVRVSMTCPPFQYWYISSFHSLRHNHRRRLSEFRSLGGSFHIDSFHT